LRILLTGAGFIGPGQIAALLAFRVPCALHVRSRLLLMRHRALAVCGSALLMRARLQLCRPGAWLSAAAIICILPVTGLIISAIPVAAALCVAVALSVAAVVVFFAAVVAVFDTAVIVAVIMVSAATITIVVIVIIVEHEAGDGWHEAAQREQPETRPPQRVVALGGANADEGQRCQ
jgi:hypothetical protein